MTILKAIWHGITRLRNLTANLLFLAIIAIVLVALFGGSSAPVLPAKFALSITPQGRIVEVKTPIDPVSRLVNGPNSKETLLADIIHAIETAATDSRVGVLVLQTEQITGASFAQLARIGDVLRDFRETGKPIIAHANFYSQSQYLLASHADTVYMHPYGSLILSGLGTYRNYYADLFEKLSVNIHVFRVGRYKALAEPYLLTAMSPEARESNAALLNDLWLRFRDRVADNRPLTGVELDDYINRFAGRLETTNGDIARLALEAQLVDELLTPDAFNARIADELESSVEDLERVELAEYVARNPRAASNGSSRAVGLITASGAISSGLLQGVNTGIVSGPTVELIRRARDDDAIRALVLRVDSPGGEVLASELIRQELELLQLAGKPLVISMGGVAASGGYWISATADHIFATPETITGSIGVVGVLPTFEKSLERLGVGVDGVATHTLAGAMTPLRELSPEVNQILQANVDHSYDRFLNLVARGRDLSKSRVDEIAQGRPWSADKALEFGLVDELGSLADALAKAAELAGLENWRIQPVTPTLSPQQQLLQRITDGMNATTSVSQTGAVKTGAVKTVSTALQAILQSELTLAGSLIGTSHGPIAELVARTGHDLAPLLLQAGPTNNPTVLAICDTCELRF